MLHFDEANHTYTQDGVALPSVTQVIKDLYHYDGIPADLLENKARFGKQVHRMCTLWAADRLDEESLSDFQRLYLEQFKHWFLGCADTNAGVIMEEPLASKLGYAGTPDLFIISRLLVDIKTRDYNPLADPVQLAGYDRLVTECLKSGSLQWGILSLYEDGYKYQIVKDHKQAWSRFRFCLDYYKAKTNYQNMIASWETTL